ncbi:MAG: hypothetical protein J6V53_01180 [Alphaproteobacteria bacterium]|nr:hypothetical protein [Alphaproteobacteria bacterium]
MNKLKISLLPKLNFDVLKVIALLTMLIDHIGHVLLIHEPVLRIIGRVTFPIFAFLMTYHLAQKGIFTKYIKRLFPFAVLSTVLIAPFDLITNGYFHLNIFWSFLIAITPLFIIEKIQKEKTNKFIKFFVSFLALFLFGTFSNLCDYDITGFIFIIALYGYFKTKRKIFLFTALIDSLLINSDHLASYPNIVMSFILVTFLTTLYLIVQSKHIQTKQKRFLKPWWIFYLFYPVHFFLLYLIKFYYF